MKNPQENKRNWWNECKMKVGYEYIKICTSVFPVLYLSQTYHHRKGHNHGDSITIFKRRRDILSGNCRG